MTSNSIGQQIPWQDLTKYSYFDIARELSLPIIWCAASVVTMHYSLALGAFCVGYTFLFGLRVVHNSFHQALGLPKWANDWVMLLVSLILVGSAHAVYVTHMYHHRHCLERDDIEGKLAHYPFWQALMVSPIYPIQIHLKALEISSPDNRRWIAVELITSITLHLAIFPSVFGPIYYAYLAMMVSANILAPMFGIWVVHRECDQPVIQARCRHSSVINFLTGNMFYHNEHHLFPEVPSRNLPKLVARLDAYTK